jgi:hypothetical protein
MGENNIPKGFRKLNDLELVDDFKSLDSDGNYEISKNEWMINCLLLLAKDIQTLNEEAPDAIMSKIQELSDEFDKIDTDKNKVIDYLEYKDFVSKNILISD